ncbi:unnamed protein product [Lymnaea stagnalis]|uniref:LisH domain-containing protein n=1 Tax=Lymnaea stagnalis TaxID=6523 RepID=A0AAV2H1X3_LYMST
MDQPEYLSAEELRNRLYHSLRDRGLVDSLKSQLRNSLVTELKQTVHGPLTIKDLKVPEGGSLLHRASNSLVANHLRSCQYEYTLSVFLPESGLNQDKKFETVDLLKLLNISPQSRLYQRLSAHTQQDSKRGFLWQLLSEVSSLHANSINNVGCQTDLIKVGPITPLDEKLSDVDELYASRRDDFLRTGRSGAEERLLSFQRQLEDRYNTQLKMELARMRDSEIATMKIEERENGRKSLEQARRELERVYKDKYDALVIRERNTLERLQQQTEMQEREMHAQRQSILEEIEAVRQREAEVKREAEVNKREKRLTEDRVKDKESDVRRRELEVQQRETSFEQKLQNEMAQFKLDQQARFIERIQNVEVREATLKEQERIVSEEKARLQQIKDELRDKTHRVNELETKISEAKYSEIDANKNNEYLNAKLRDMSDYKTLKEQVILYRNELETLRTRLAEVLSMNERERGRQEELLRELRRPSPESLMLQRDLERAKESLRQEQLVFNQQKQLLEIRLKEELDRNKDLMQRFEEQMLQMKEMNREIVDLRQHLHMTTKALNNEVYRKPDDGQDEPQRNDLRRSQKAHNSNENSVDFNLDVSGPRRSLRFEPDPKEVYHDVDFGLGSVYQPRDGVYFDDDQSSSDSADIIAQAKYRLKSLDHEAHNLEKAYHDFHCRMTNVNALPAEPQPVIPSVTRNSAPKQDVIMRSPVHSPIPFDNPMSSTPYKQPRKAQEFNDSFAELGTPHLIQRKATSHQDQSQRSHSIAIDQKEYFSEKPVVQKRSITVDDLEQRPGSPPIMVIAESISSDEGKRNLRTDTGKFDTIDAVYTSMPDSPIETKADPVLQTQHFSLDSAWKTQTREEEQAEYRTKKEMEEENRQGEGRLVEERLDREEKGWKKEPENVEAPAAAASKEDNDDDKIDPVMKQYMAMVQQQKEKEKQLAKATSGSKGKLQDKTPSQSESEELSVAIDDKTEHDDDFSSW